jgi:hypothetical protein
MVIKNIASKSQPRQAIINENIRFSQNDVKLVIDEAKEKIEKSQKAEENTKKRGGKYRRRKTKKLRKKIKYNICSI